LIKKKTSLDKRASNLGDDGSLYSKVFKDIINPPLPKSLARIQDPRLNEIWRLDPALHAYVTSNKEYILWPYIKYMSSVVRKAIRRGNGRIIISAPPRHGKSWFTSYRLPIWYLDLFPKKKIVIVSNTHTNAKKWGKLVRNEITNNPQIKVEIARGSSDACLWETTQGGMMRSIGVEGGLIGEGADLILIDDPYATLKSATSYIQRTSIQDWFLGTLYNRREPNATIILIQHRMHEEDLSGYLIKTSDEWINIKFPALAEEGDLLGRALGEPLCPSRWPKPELLKTKGISQSYVWNGLYQQRPSVLEGNVIKRDWFQRWTTLPKFDRVFQSWDLSFKKTGTSFVSGQVWGSAGPDIYLLDRAKEKMSFTETLDSIRAVSTKHQNSIIKLIEDAANGPAAISTLKKELVGITPITPKGSKDERLSVVSPIIKSGNVYVPDMTICNWVEDFVDEICNFPNHPTRDDVDAMSQALTWWLEQQSITKIYSLDLSGGRKTSEWDYLNIGGR